MRQGRVICGITQSHTQFTSRLCTEVNQTALRNATLAFNLLRCRKCERPTHILDISIQGSKVLMQFCEE